MDSVAKTTWVTMGDIAMNKMFLVLVSATFPDGCSGTLDCGACYGATVCVRNQCQAPSPDADAPGGAATVTASPGGCNCGGSSALLAGMLVVPVALRRRQPGVAR